MSNKSCNTRFDIAAADTDDEEAATWLQVSTGKVLLPFQKASDPFPPAILICP